MVTAKNIYEELNLFAPIEMKMDFDNVGFLVGNSQCAVTRVLTALDITDDVIKEAIEARAQVIVSHHPLFFGLKSVNDMEPTGRKIVELISHNISAICMHTNLDAAFGGVNDALAEKVGLENIGLLSVDGKTGNGTPYGIGRVGELSSKMKFADFLAYVKDALDAGGLRYHDAGRMVKKVGVLGGSGGSELEKAITAGCDTYITADVKYDVFLRAKEAGVNLIDGDHFCTENVVIPAIAKLLQEKFPSVEVLISDSHKQTAKFYV